MTGIHAVYPGSFDPITNGHMDIVHRAALVFPKLTVAVVVNPQKRSPMFTLEEREQMIRESVAGLANVRVDHFRGLLAEYVKHIEANLIVKGLRVVSDFESEMSTALMNRSLSKDVDTAFMMASAEFSFVSSSLVKEVFFLGGDVSPFVPQHVLRTMEMRRRSLTHAT
ncbi:MAG TPA: pantetheine-phosphate adenylyltransferase [Candidatus Dormibacteraeota bacterium]|nr:pantetheine-phosphate adenylyltransferase [Candidatus Dormibacteraeota bacterium]